jgi:nucleoside-diphosphate-sugar epimerase
MAERILVTGSNGVVGSIVTRDLRTDHEIRGFGRHAPPPAPGRPREDFVVGDLEDERSIAGAMVGIGAVIHLAANGDPDATWSDVLGPNIIGARNVFEAARAAGIRRVVFASSNHASGIDTIEGRPATAARPPAAANVYGVSKAFAEVLGHQYAVRHGLSVICLRIGWVGPEDDRSIRPPDVDDRTESMWISHRDLTQIVRRSLETELLFGVFYAMSGSASDRWDIADAERRLGYRPLD